MLPVRKLVVTLVAALLLSSCTTIRESGRHPAGAEGAGVRVAVFADDEARAAGRVLGTPVAGVLERRAGRGWTPLFRSLEPTWAVAGLAPGRYRMSFEATLDARGQAEDLDRPVRQEIDVRAGEVVEVEVLLDHVSPAMVAAGAVAVVLAAVLLHEWLDDLDLPTPPRPPAWAVEAAFWVTLDLASEPRIWVPRDPSPQVTSHFPRDGDLVAAERVRVIFSLSEPLADDRLDPRTIVVETEDGTRIPGHVEWDPRRWWVTWEPDEELPRDSRLHATLNVESIVDGLGYGLPHAVSFDFSTTP